MAKRKPVLTECQRDCRAYLCICLEQAGIRRANDIAHEYLFSGKLDKVRSVDDIEALAKEITNEYTVLG